MNNLVSLLRGKPELKSKKQEVINDILPSENCTIVDSIYDTVEALLEEKTDYQIVINKLEKTII